MKMPFSTKISSNSILKAAMFILNAQCVLWFIRRVKNYEKWFLGSKSRKIGIKLSTKTEQNDINVNNRENNKKECISLSAGAAWSQKLVPSTLVYWLRSIFIFSVFFYVLFVVIHISVFSHCYRLTFFWASETGLFIDLTLFHLFSCVHLYYNKHNIHSKYTCPFCMTFGSHFIDIYKWRSFEWIKHVHNVIPINV